MAAKMWNKKRAINENCQMKNGEQKKNEKEHRMNEGK